MFKPSRGFKKLTAKRAAGVAAGLGALVFVASVGEAQAAEHRATSHAFRLTAISTVAKDSFDRTVASGFGTANVGGQYRTSTSAGVVLSVADGRGAVDGLQRGGSDNETLSATSARDVDVQSTLVVPQVSSARIGLYDAMVVRRQANGDRYLVKTYIGAGGQVTLSSSFAPGGKADVGIGKPVKLSFAIKSGDELITEGRVVGSGPVIFLERAWVKGSPVPKWQFISVDRKSKIKSAGAVGFGSYLSTTGTPTSIQRDDFSAVTIGFRPSGTATSTTNKPTTSTTSKPTTSTTSTTVKLTTTTAPPATTTTTTRPPSTTTTAPPNNGGGSFTFAVMPDTQQEVLNPGDTRFVNRTNWLVANEKSLNLKFVSHTGDVDNWDTPDHSQYVVSQAAMRPLEAAGVPYTLAIGNHDTEATGVGGSARDPKNTRALQRDTTTFNTYFKADRYRDVSGQFEAGKVDNLYATYQAGGTNWMVLVLEFDPRVSVINWAKQVVAAHPGDNVVVITHSYLNADLTISSNAEYGDTSGQYMFDNLISQYSNIKMVFSGHVGIAGSRTDTGVHGNKIIEMLQTYHSNSTNPVRLVKVDADAGTVNSYVYAPFTNETIASGAASYSGMTFVK